RGFPPEPGRGGADGPCGEYAGRAGRGVAARLGGPPRRGGLGGRGRQGRRAREGAGRDGSARGPEGEDREVNPRPFRSAGFGSTTTRNESPPKTHFRRQPVARPYPSSVH